MFCVDGLINNTPRNPHHEQILRVYKFIGWDLCLAVLRIRIRDPVPFRPLDPGSGIGLFRIPDPKLIFLKA
jgi:hypothetical protein